MKLLSELSEDDSCDEIIPDDYDNIHINSERNFCKKSLKHHRPNLSDIELSESIPCNCSGGSFKAPINRKFFEENRK